MTVHVTESDAQETAAAGWAGFPLVPGGKVPAIPSAHRDGTSCRGECGRDGHGFLDATTDPDRLAEWWHRYPNANLGIAVPAHLAVLDKDPRHGSDVTMAALEAHHGPVPPTLTQRTGGGGDHLFFEHPCGQLRNPGPGLDVRVGGRHYLVAAPSWVRQPAESEGDGHYRWIDPDAPIAPMPAWLVDAMRPQRITVRTLGPRTAAGVRPGDRFNASTTWSDVLLPAGWFPIAQRGDVIHWCRPGKRRRSVSAVTGGREDILFVFSTMASPLETERSYDKFGAWVALAHGGDFAAAVRALRVAS